MSKIKECNKLLLVIGFFLLIAGHWSLTTMHAQTAGSPPAAADNFTLNEVEALKGDNLQLRYDSLDKQAQLMERQYIQLKEEQRRLIEQLQVLEREILVRRSLSSDEWRVNWQTKKAENKPSPPAEAEKKK